MTYRECAVAAWKELGWSEEKIKLELEARDKNASVILDVTYKPVPAEFERQVIDFLKGLATAPEEERKKMREEGQRIIAQKQAKAINN
jgi:hypothetical protein